MMDLTTTLMYLGVPIQVKLHVWGQESVVTSSMIPTSILSKRHHISSYQHVRELRTAEFTGFYWKDGKANLADILSKHWEFASMWPHLKPLLFWRGDTKVATTSKRRVLQFQPTIHPVIQPMEVAILA